MGRKVFRNLMDQDAARKKFYQHLRLDNFSTEEVSLVEALNRVLVEDIFSPINVPPFDRAAMDGFAVIAEDTKGAGEESPIQLKVVGEVQAGYTFDGVLNPGECIEISTGAPMPDGANAVVMVEYTQRTGSDVSIYRSVTPNQYTMAAGADIERGQRIISSGRLLTSRELATISAIGKNTIKVIKKPRVAVFSSGDEIVPPGSKLKPGKLFDINSTAIITSVMENGGFPVFKGIIEDNRSDIKEKLSLALNEFDLVLISGGTSAGMGDMLYEVVDELGPPGLLVHGVKVKPGKPTILAVCDGTPIVGLPGYPASALSIHQLFVIPLIRILAGLPPVENNSIISARITKRFVSTEGRYEFKPVSLFRDLEGWIAQPVPGGSGAITSVALADGFVRIPENTHFISSGSQTDVHLLSEQIIPPVLQVIGSHDVVIHRLQQEFERNYPSKPIRLLDVGSTKGISAVREKEAHISVIHQPDESGDYNRWVEDEDMTIIPGYYRMLGLMVEKDNPKSIYSLKDLIREDVTFINRDPSSGVRVLLEILLEKIGIDFGTITGFDKYVRSDVAAAQAIGMGEADVSIGSEYIARSSNLSFIELREEELDLLIRKEFLNDRYVKQFLDIFHSQKFKDYIDSLVGYRYKT